VLIIHVMTWSHIDLVLEVDAVLIAMNDWDLLPTLCENTPVIISYRIHDLSIRPSSRIS